MSDLEQRKQLGRAHLSANRLDLALQLFAQLVEEFPEDVESRVILGDCYLAGADYSSAQQLYQQALDVDPTSEAVLHRLRLTQAELLKPQHANDTFRLPTSKDSISMLLQELTGRSNPVEDEEILSAAELLEEMVNSDQPAQVVARHLEHIDALLPALLELNIKQAEADGKPDLALGLQNLRDNIFLQKGVMADAGLISATAVSVSNAPLRILVLGESVLPGGRSEMILRALQVSGTCELIRAQHSKEIPDPSGIDLVLAFSPHTDAGMIKTLAGLAAHDIPVILDLECDFENLPVQHPLHQQAGLATAARSKTYAACLSLADVITTPSPVLAVRLKDAGHNSVMMPDSWDQDNPLWHKPAPQRQTINLGWIGSPGYVEDVASVRRSIVRILREFPQTQLVISGDPEVYQLFDNIPEFRRIYLPDVTSEDFPSLLAQVDIRLVPLRNTVFNRSAPDRPLMEAGVHNSPWIASPIPAYHDWNAGGEIANDRESWYSILKEYITHAEKMTAHGESGRQAAKKRELRQISQLWSSLIHTLTTSTTEEVSSIQAGRA